MAGAHERKFRVLIVDDQEIVTWGFRLLFTREAWVERCVTAVTTEQAVVYAKRFTPHVALVDVLMGTESGVEVANKIRSVSPETRILLTSGAAKISPKAVRAAGAAGFVSKAWPPGDLARAVRMVGLGLNLTRPAEPEPVTSQLTLRERDVLQGIANGATNAQIGAELSLSLHTVKQHASSIFRKLGVHNRAEAVQRGQRLGYIE
jgi:two-component system response regulator DesR